MAQIPRRWLAAMERTRTDAEDLPDPVPTSRTLCSKCQWMPVMLFGRRTWMSGFRGAWNNLPSCANVMQ